MRLSRWNSRAADATENKARMRSRWVSATRRGERRVGETAKSKEDLRLHLYTQIIVTVAMPLNPESAKAEMRTRHQCQG